MNRVWTIYRKELLDTLRDRKTLVFMLLLPTVMMPALLFVGMEVALGIVKRNATQEVIIAADAQTREHYREMAHTHFRKSKIGGALKVARSPLVDVMVRDGLARDLLNQVPKDVFETPESYAEWARQLGSQAGEALEEASLEDVRELEGLDMSSLPQSARSAGDFEDLSRDIFDFYRVTVRGLGLVEFVDPAELDPLPKYQQEELPEALVDMENGRGVYTAIREKKIHGYLSLPQGPRALEGKESGQLEGAFFHDSTIPLSSEANSRVGTVLNRAGESIVSGRLEEKGLSRSFLHPVKLKSGTNLASTSKIALAQIGGMLPYLIVVFAFLGGIYPSIDLGAGEKERGTLETLLLSPVSRTEIALGKFFLILTTSLTAAILGVASMTVCVAFAVPDVLLEQLDIQVDMSALIAVLLLALPPAAAFSGLFLAVSIYARTFKEAQNYLSPLPIVFIVPASAGLIPGLEMSWKLALVPLVNVSLLSRDFLKGDPNWGYYALTLLSCGALTALCLAFCVWMFRREQVLFRT